jgi:hypothetical protein
MAEQKKTESKEETKAPDLSLSNLLPMPIDEIEKFLDKRETLEQIAKDPRHVQILIYHMLRFNVKAIDDFNKTSKRASNVLILLSIAMIVIVLVQLLVAIF